jgi:hypothetical protein
MANADTAEVPARDARHLEAARLPRRPAADEADLRRRAAHVDQRVGGERRAQDDEPKPAGRQSGIGERTLDAGEHAALGRVRGREHLGRPRPAPIPLA